MTAGAWWLVIFLGIPAPGGQPTRYEITGPFTEEECQAEKAALPVRSWEAVCLRDWKLLHAAESAWAKREVPGP